MKRQSPFVILTWNQGIFCRPVYLYISTLSTSTLEKAPFVLSIWAKCFHFCYIHAKQKFSAEQMLSCLNYTILNMYNVFKDFYLFKFLFQVKCITPCNAVNSDCIWKGLMIFSINVICLQITPTCWQHNEQEFWIMHKLTTHISY